MCNKREIVNFIHLNELFLQCVILNEQKVAILGTYIIIQSANVLIRNLSSNNHVSFIEWLRRLLNSWPVVVTPF